MPEIRAGSQLAALLAPVSKLSARRELVMLLLILAETMIVYLYAGTLLAEHEAPHQPLPVMLIFTTLLVAYLIPHMLETMRIWTPEYEIVMAIGLAGSLLMVFKIGAFPDAALLSTGWLAELRDALILRDNTAIRAVWMLVAFVVYAWWRGRTRAEPVLETGYRMLRFGTLGIAGGLLLTVGTAPADAAIYQSVNIVVVSFVVFTLLAITVARQPSERQTSQANSGWLWVLILIVPVLAIAATTVSAVGILTRETLELFLHILSPALWLAGQLLRAVILTIAIIAFILIAPVIWFLDRQGINPLANIPSIELAPSGVAEFERTAQETLGIGDPIRYLVVGTLALILGWLLIRFAFHRRRQWRPMVHQQRESLIEWEDGPESLLQRVTRWLSASVRWQRSDNLPADPAWQGTRRVRLAYRAYLRLNKRHRLGRDQWETPTEYARRVNQTWATLAPDVDHLTSAYNLARYSGNPLSEETAAQSEQSLQRISAEIDNETVD